MQFDQQNRREFITLLGGAVVWPLPLRAQESAQVSRIGVLRSGPASAFAGRAEALRAGLRQLGYVEGKNIVIEFRWAETVDQLPKLAAELVRTNVDVIFAPSSTETEAARQATKTIPIVFGTHADPVGLGHVASLARPGGNITGLTVILTDLAAKGLEILKEAVPGATRIGVLFSPTAPSHRPAVQALETAGEKLGVQLLMAPVRTVDDFDGAFVTMARERVGGFFVPAEALTVSHRARLAELALKHRLPGMFGTRDNVEAGGLMSYGPDLNDLTRRAATYIDKILKGAKPADLPVEEASKYYLIINLKTAKAIGLTISESFLLRADELIE
jgi:putative tryptophan/tyrosine transport system substrate-binding protein